MFMGFVLVYAEVNIICIILTAYLLTRLNNSIGSESEINTLRLLMIAILILAVTDALWMLGEQGPLPFNVASNWLANTVYDLAYIAVAYFWFRYNELMLGKWPRYPLSIRIISVLPLAAAVFLTFASLKTGWVFYIEADNTYSRGSFRSLFILLIYGYLIFAGFHDLICSGRERVRAKRKQERALAAYVVIPLIFNTIQTIDVRIPGAAIGSTISVLLIYISMQDSLISRDSMTGLNNRRRADEYLESRMDDRNPGLVFMICDIDSFKGINDEFGHLEGDEALIIAAKAMKAICEGNNAFLARYGGDEFCIIWIPKSEKNINIMIDDIQSKLNELCEEANKPYTLQMSFGYAINAELMTDAELINRADYMLYEKKAAIHEKDENYVSRLYSQKNRRN